MTRAGTRRTTQGRARLAVRTALWSLAGVLLLVVAVSVPTTIRATEDPADPTATVWEDCGTLLSPTAAGQGSSADAEQDAGRHARVCDPARHAKMLLTVPALVSGVAAAVLAVVVRRRPGRRDRRAVPGS